MIICVMIILKWCNIMCVLMCENINILILMIIMIMIMWNDK